MWFLAFWGKRPWYADIEGPSGVASGLSSFQPGLNFRAGLRGLLERIASGEKTTNERIHEGRNPHPQP